MPPSARQSLAPTSTASANVKAPRASLAPVKSRMSMAGGADLLGRPSLPGPSGLGGRPSTAGPRQSTAPGAGGVQKDPRQLETQRWKDGAKHKLIEYFVEHGYDKQISPATLQTGPSMREFVFMVTFLLKRVFGPSFEVPTPLDDELPRIFKELGYPFQLPKHALRNNIVPHDWPKLLGALTWLVDNCAYQDQMQRREQEAGDDFDAEVDEDAANFKMYLDYLARGYKLFLEGVDDMSPLDEQMRLTFDAKNASIEQDVRNLTAEHARLHAEAESLQPEKSVLVAAQTKQAELAADYAKHSGHAHKLQEAIDKYAAATGERGVPLGRCLISSEDASQDASEDASDDNSECL